MGTTLSLLQIHSDREPRAVLDAAALAVETLASDVPDGGRLAGRLLLAPLCSGWLSLISEPSRGTRSPLERLARRVSESLRCVVVYADLYDSDALLVRGFDEGELHFEWTLEPGGEQPHAGGQARVGLWQATQLVEALAGSDTFAEARLSRLGASLGWSSETQTWVFDAVTRSQPTTLEVFYEVHGGRTVNPDRPWNGLYHPPKLVESVTVAAGEEIVLPVRAFNIGNATTGLRVFAWGRAIGEGIVPVSVRCPCGTANAHHIAAFTQLPGVFPVAYAADLTDVRIEEGPAHGMEPALVDPRSFEGNTSLEADVVLEAHRPGAYDLSVAMVPADIEDPRIRATSMLGYRWELVVE